jgi:hypothetical protein
MHGAAGGELMLVCVLANQLHHVRPEVNTDLDAAGAAGIAATWLGLASASHRRHTRVEGWSGGHRNQQGELTSRQLALQRFPLGEAKSFWHG